ANEAKTQNTHLHVLEAYTKLCQINPAQPIQKALRNLISLFLDHFIDPKTHHIHLFFDENWKLKSDIISFGHDIEASWLLWEAAKTLNDPALLEQLKPVCLNIAEATLQEAIDHEGALMNERHVGQNQLDTDRIWWVQAEAMVGFWNAWQLSGQVKYQDAALRIWEFIRHRQRDTVQGEWHWAVSAEGIPNPNEDKAGFWKCPYHNGRAMMEIIERLESW
ncbi:MAG: AGE family epimerase/isomerase, partial [Bacteroidota bacterium]